MDNKKETISKCNKKENFSEIAENWLEDVFQKRKFSTYIKYKNIYEKHLKTSLGYKFFSEISTEEYATTLNNIFLTGNKNNTKLSQSAANSICTVMFQIIDYGEQAILIPDIRKKILVPHKTNTSPKGVIFTKNEQKRLIDYLLDDINSYKLGVLLSLFTGIRLGELCALETNSINIDRRVIEIRSTVQRIQYLDSPHKTSLYISIPKTQSSYRDVPICNFLVDLLRDNMPDTKYLINGNALMEPRTYQYKFKKYMNDLSINNINFHALRHTFATNCIECGMDVKCLSEILGHADVKTTLNRYVHPSHDMKIKQVDNLAILLGQKTD